MTKSSPGPEAGDPDSGDKDSEALAPGEWTGRAATSKSNQWLTYLNLGWLMVANMAVFTGGGLWADRKFGTAPILLLIGVFLGFFGCGYTIYRAVKKIESDERARPRN